MSLPDKGRERLAGRQCERPTDRKKEKPPDRGVGDGQIRMNRKRQTNRGWEEPTDRQRDRQVSHKECVVCGDVHSVLFICFASSEVQLWG